MKKEGEHLFRIPHKYNKDDCIMIQHPEFFTKPERVKIVHIELHTIGMLVCVHYTLATSAGLIPSLNEHSIDKLVYNADYINRMNQLKQLIKGA